MASLLLSFLRVPLFTPISNYLRVQFGFCKANQNCLVALIKITTVDNLKGQYTEIAGNNIDKFKDRVEINGSELHKLSTKTQIEKKTNEWIHVVIQMKKKQKTIQLM